MDIEDKLQRFIFENAPVRGEHVRLQASYQTIIQQHDYPPALKKLLGEALCATVLLSAIIKFKGRLTLQFRGKGKLKLLLAQSDNNFNLRALAKWSGEMSFEELMESFNEGVLVIMLDGGAQKGQYQGIVAWRGNSLVESLEGYFRESEQLATKIWMEVTETQVVGYLLQAIPNAGVADHVIENELIAPHWEHIMKLTSKMYPIDLLTIDCTSLLTLLYQDEEIRVFPAIDVRFGCTCSRQRGADAIRILGQEEAESELKDKNSIVVTCDFCNEEYIFDRVDVAKIFEDDDNAPPTDIQLH